jgi:hypothetical protein
MGLAASVHADQPTERETDWGEGVFRRFQRPLGVPGHGPEVLGSTIETGRSRMTGSLTSRDP